jgi:hypothetical protein
MDLSILNTMANILERLPLHTILMELLERPEFKTSTTHTAIIQNAEALVHVLLEHPDTCFKTHDVAFKACTQTLMSEIATMGRKSNGWHFSAQKASSEQIEGFLIADMSQDLQVHTPQLWDAFQVAVMRTNHGGRRAFAALFSFLLVVRNLYALLDLLPAVRSLGQF